MTRRGMVLVVQTEDEGDDVPEAVDAVASQVLNAAFRVHSRLGPGLLESVYSRCLVQALKNEGLHVQREVWVPVEFEGLVLEDGLRMDLLVEDALVVEVKSVDALHAVHEAQLLTYLRLARKPLGLLLNFNVRRLQHGIRRFAMTRSAR